MSDKRMLRTVNSAAYFKYNVPFYIANDNQTQAQLTFVIENIVGGTLRMGIFFFLFIFLFSSHRLIFVLILCRCLP